MGEKYLVFTFAGIMLALVFHLLLAVVFSHFFSTWRLALTFWYVPHIVTPALLLLALAWGLGFFRRKGSRLADLAVLATGALIVVCTIGAPYNCWNQFCF